MSLDEFQWRFHSRRTMMMVGSTKSLLTWVFGAEDGIRTRDPHLGKVMRYRCATSAWNHHSIAPDIEGSEPGAALTWPFSRPGPRRVTPRRALGRLPIVRQDEDTAVQSRSFGEVADEYNRLRPGPSDEALDWLIPTGASDVLEVGAGTGILTRLLAGRVAHVTAVEPDDRMRDVLVGHADGVEVLAGHAEQIPVDSSSYDMVIAASAWHWVDEERAVPEVARVLRPGGRLSLVWSGPDRSLDWMRSLWAGGIVFAPEDAAEMDARRRRRHVVNVDIGGKSPFLEPETALFRWSRPDDERRRRRARHHVQRRDRHGGRRTTTAPRGNGDLPRHPRAVRRSGCHRRAHALILLASYEALTCADVPGETLRGCDKGP